MTFAGIDDSRIVRYSPRKAPATQLAEAAQALPILDLSNI
jgi:hypothetical protein